MNNGNTETGSRILVVKLSSMGDLFHALPTVHNLKTGFNASVDWVTQTEYAGLVSCFTDVDRVIPFPRHDRRGKLFRFIHDLRQNEYSYVFDLQGLLKSALIARLARGARRVGPSFHREGSRLFYSSVAGTLNKQRHAVDEMMDAIGHLGLPAISPEFPVKFPEWNPAGDAPRIAVFPVTRWKTKNWPQDSFASALRTIQRLTGGTVFVMGGPEEAVICRHLHADLKGKAFNLAGSLSLVETGSVLSRMNIVISNDSGPMHMAAAIGVPVVAIFGPTNPIRTGPYGSGHTVLAGRRSCVPCYKRQCAMGPTLCLREVSPDTVVEAVRAILGY